MGEHPIFKKCTLAYLKCVPVVEMLLMSVTEDGESAGRIGAFFLDCSSSPAINYRSALSIAEGGGMSQWGGLPQYSRGGAPPLVLK